MGQVTVGCTPSCRSLTKAHQKKGGTSTVKGTPFQPKKPTPSGQRGVQRPQEKKQGKCGQTPSGRVEQQHQGVRVKGKGKKEGSGTKKRFMGSGGVKGSVGRDGPSKGGVRNGAQGAPPGRLPWTWPRHSRRSQEAKGLEVPNKNKKPTPHSLNSRQRVKEGGKKQGGRKGQEGRVKGGVKKKGGGGEGGGRGFQAPVGPLKGRVKVGNFHVEGRRAAFSAFQGNQKRCHSRSRPQKRSQQKKKIIQNTIKKRITGREIKRFIPCQAKSHKSKVRPRPQNSHSRGKEMRGGVGGGINSHGRSMSRKGEKGGKGPGGGA